MNLSEFKAWFEGFTENLDGAPDKKQWAKIEAKVKLIKDAPATTYPVFVDRYIPQWPYWRSGTYYGGTGYAQSNTYGGGTLLNDQAPDPNRPQGMGGLAGFQARTEKPEEGDGRWNASDVFRQLGRIEAAA